ncbi:MAG: PAS domain S-box protein [Balneolales bacterium]
MPEHSRILIVEDEFILAQDIKNRLTALHYEVVGLCSNGKDAIQNSQEKKPDLVLMDIRLEGDMDGIVTAEKIQKKMDIPVVFLSAYADKETVKRARMSEPMGYLIKPVEEKELETTIEMALYKHQVTQRMRENEQWLSTTMNHVGDAVIRTDADKRIMLLNPTANLLTGWSQEQAIGHELDKVLKLVDEDTMEEIENPIYKKIGDTQPAIMEPRFLLKSRDGKETPVDFSSNPIKNETGDMIGLVIVIHNITERRRSEQVIERRLRLEKALDEVTKRLLGYANPNFKEILGLIGTAMKADRGFIIELLENTQIATSVSEWTTDDRKPILAKPSDADTLLSDWFYSNLQMGKSLIITDNQDEHLEAEKETLAFCHSHAFQAVPMKDANGNLSGFIGFASSSQKTGWSDQDLQILRVMSESIGSFKARKKVENELKRSETRFRSLIQNSSDLISVIDRNGKFVYQSPSAEKVLGYKPEELVGQSAFKFIHEEEKDSIRKELLQKINKKNDQLNLEFRLKHKDGSWRDLEAVGKHMHYDRRIEGFVINSRDVTERKKANLALKKAKEKAEEMNRLKTTFLANMSHEIRTPLTGILGYASIMQSELEGEGDREMARRIHDSGKRLLATIDAILDLAKIEADKLDIKLRPVNLRQELTNSVQLLTPLAAQRGLNLELDASDEIFAHLDPQFFGQVMNNLIGNALKYTKKGKVKVTVEVKCPEESSQEMAVIHIEDTGVGISEEFMHKIFDEFEQESVGLSRKFEGAGLGLTITKKLVDVMNGKISVQSEKGVGSTFTVMFPTAEPDDSVYIDEEVDEDQVMREIRAVHQHNMPKLLLVEDNVDSQIVTRNFLNGSFALDSCNNGEDAIKQLEKKHYDIILMDINLGDGIDGVETMHRIRKKSEYKKTPVLAITAYAMKEDEIYYLKEGFSGYLSKPFTKEDIYSMIGKTMNRYRHA